MLARLTQFGADPGNIEEYAEAVKNLAGLMGGDIESAARLFSRAMNGNTTALSRMGIEVDKNASAQEKLEQIQAQLAQRGGGQLEKQTETLTGHFKTLGNATADFFKGIGNLISRTGVLQVTLEAAAAVLTFFGSAFPQVVKKVEGLENKLPDLDTALKTTGKTADDTGGEMGGLALAAEGAKDSAENLAQEGLEKLKKSLDEVSEKTRTAIGNLERLQEQQDKMDSAELALAVARIKGGEGTDQEKLVAERDVRRQYADAKDKRADETDAAKIATLQADTNRRNQIVGNAGFEVDVSKAAQADNAAQFGRVNEDYNKAREAIQHFTAELERLKDVPGPEAGLERLKDRAGLETATTALGDTKERGKRIKEEGAKIDAQLSAAQDALFTAAQEAANATQKNAEQIATTIQSGATRRYERSVGQETVQVEDTAADRQRQEDREKEARREQREREERELRDRTKPLADVEAGLDRIDTSEGADLGGKERKAGADPLARQNLRETQLERRVKQLEEAFKFRNPESAKLSPEQEAVFEAGLAGAVKAGLPVSDALLAKLAAEAARLVPALQGQYDSAGGVSGGHGGTPGTDAAGREHGREVSGAGRTDGGLTTGGLTGGGGRSSAAAALGRAPSAADALAKAPSAADALARAPGPQLGDPSKGIDQAAQQFDAYHQSVMGVVQQMQRASDTLSNTVQRNQREIENLKGQIKNSR